MRIILVALFILLTSCQNTNHDVGSATSKNTQSSREARNQDIYNRYKNKTNRYSIQQDAAPKSAKRVSFKEPVPAREPMSRYGNPSEYNVDGKKYEVIQNPTGYKSRGVASWYGTKFHKQRTSSGEPYNMYVMTAAHPTLPLPTYIKVTNLDNQKTAIVKVNDRGPFHGNRLIDLSYAAALKLGVFPKGTANVEIETLKGPAGVAHYYLQAGAFNSEASARQLKDKLKNLTTSPVFVDHYQQHYTVRVGPFADKRMVDSLKTKLMSKGIAGAFSVLV